MTVIVPHPLAPEFTEEGNLEESGIILPQLDDEDNRIGYAECSSEQKVCIRITSGSSKINIKYKIEGKTASVKTTDIGMNRNTFSNTILLGAYRDSSDVKGRYWKGTINSFTVYDRVLTDEEVNALFE